MLVLHNVNHRGKAKRLADICLVLNVEDTHLVQLRAEKAGAPGSCVTADAPGKEKTVAITPSGEQA